MKNKSQIDLTDYCHCEVTSDNVMRRRFEHLYEGEKRIASICMWCGKIDNETELEAVKASDKESFAIRT
jgi:hypothetical protein